MRKKDRKYYIGIAVMLFINSLHYIFFTNNDKYDVYLFYNHSRYFTNILYDISGLFSFSLLTYWLIDLSYRIFKPLFIVSLATWLSYFTYYNQKTSLVLIPLYIILSFVYNKNILK